MAASDLGCTFDQLTGWICDHILQGPEIQTWQGKWMGFEQLEVGFFSRYFSGFPSPTAIEIHAAAENELRIMYFAVGVFFGLVFSMISPDSPKVEFGSIWWNIHDIPKVVWDGLLYFAQFATRISLGILGTTDQSRQGACIDKLSQVLLAWAHDLMPLVLQERVTICSLFKNDQQNRIETFNHTKHQLQKSCEISRTLGNSFRIMRSLLLESDPEVCDPPTSLKRWGGSPKIVEECWRWCFFTLLNCRCCIKDPTRFAPIVENLHSGLECFAKAYVSKAISIMEVVKVPKQFQDSFQFLEYSMVWQWLRDKTNAVLQDIVAPCSTDLICFHPKLSVVLGRAPDFQDICWDSALPLWLQLCHSMNWATLLMMFVCWPMFEKKTHTQLSPKQRKIDLNISTVYKSLWDGGSNLPVKWFSMMFVHDLFP